MAYNLLNPEPQAIKAFSLDTWISWPARRRYARIVFDVFLLLLLITAFFYFLPKLSFHKEIDEALGFGVSSVLFRYGNYFYGALLLFLGLLLDVVAIEFYYRSNLNHALLFELNKKRYYGSIEVLRIMSYAKILFVGNVSLSHFAQVFSGTDFAKVLFLRLGIADVGITPWVTGERNNDIISSDALFGAALKNVERRGATTIRVGDIFSAIITHDKAFRDFLFQQKIKEQDFIETAFWVEHIFNEEGRQSVWWSKNRLLRFPSITRDLGYGYTFTLDEFSYEVTSSRSLLEREARVREIRSLEQVLARSYEANALLVGDEGSGRHTIIDGLARQIRLGYSAAELWDKRIIVLDGARLVAYTKELGNYEELLLKIFTDAVKAGNILLVIDDLPALIESAHGLSVNVLNVIEPFLARADLQVIAITTRAQYHKVLEPDSKMAKLFERVEVEEPKPARTIRMLEDALVTLEIQTGHIFTYQAIKRAEELARRFITEGAMPKKAIDLLDSASANAVGRSMIIKAQDIDAIVEKKTKIPTLPAEGEEKDKLLHLEEILHKKIIGQDHAINAVSNALRRARSGLREGTRPLGTFLFLGPTGVGKTETAKALADAYFGDRDAMIRFDMSEYQGDEGMQRLIGSTGQREPGVLSSRLRERPFSLLLFDEFEKASHEVVNLFLQILDEGKFSDAEGREVSARESMIIMTSNAGANAIWDMLKAGKNNEQIQEETVEAVRAEGKFPPELLNRFDAMVVYHPLTKEELSRVAMLLLGELQKKLKEKDIRFEPTKALAERVVEIGYDKTFGARPMRRVIQDHIEQVIAKKMLAGELKRGDSFQFEAQDIKDL